MSFRQVDADEGIELDTGEKQTGSLFFNTSDIPDGEYTVRLESDDDTQDILVDISLPGEEQIANYLEDDFDDNSLTSRSNTNDGVYAHPDANVAGDVFIGRYRPEWNATVNDSGSVSATNGRVEFSEAGPEEVTGAISVPSDFTTGSFQSDVNWVTRGSGDDNFTVQYISDSYKVPGDSNQYPDNGVLTQTTDTGTPSLVKSESGSGAGIVSSTVTSDSYTESFTRDSYGNYEYIIDGASQGTTTDTFLPEDPSYVQVALRGSSGGSTVSIDNLVVQ